MDDAEVPKINIFIAEDHEITRVGLRLTLEHVPGFSVVGEAADGKMTVKKVAELKPPSRSNGYRIAFDGWHRCHHENQTRSARDARDYAHVA